MRIGLLEPYDTGSHGVWWREYARYTQHTLVPFTLGGQFWKWRMHGGAVTLARYYRERSEEVDLFLATDMVDLTTFLALTRATTHGTPVALYMHENQLTYPLRPGEKRDLHYGFINYASMLCADGVFFNSAYHLEAWFDELPRLLKHFPDYNELPSVAGLRARSAVLPLGLALAGLDAHRPAAPQEGPALIVWNHRWEYDKNPGEFLDVLCHLAAEGVEFRVAILGENFVRVPPEFEVARGQLGERVVQFGYAPSRADYARWLWQADIVVSTALHDFFGAAVVEALYCGCWPVLPWRLTYPQFVPPDVRARCLYRSHEELLALLRDAIAQAEARRADSEGTVAALRAVAAEYDWGRLAPHYDRILAAVGSNA